MIYLQSNSWSDRSMAYYNPIILSLLITTIIFILSTVTLKAVINLIPWFRKYNIKSSIINHRKGKKKKLNLQRKFNTYIGQKVKQKPQRIGRKFSFVSRTRPKLHYNCTPIRVTLSKRNILNHRNTWWHSKLKHKHKFKPVCVICSPNSKI